MKKQRFINILIGANLAVAATVLFTLDVDAASWLACAVVTGYFAASAWLLRFTRKVNSHS